MKHDEQRVLDILKEKEMHGYEIIVKLNRDVDKSFEYRIGTLYPILRLLEKRRFLKSYEINKDGKSRIYYKRTTKQGCGNSES